MKMMTNQLFITNTHEWLCKGFFGCPPTIKSVINQKARNADYFSPFSNTVLFPPKFKDMIVEPVSLLVFHTVPSTVLSTIITQTINSINRGLFFAKFFNMFSIRYVHVVSKLFKRFPKAFNSLCAVPFVGMIFGVSTPSKHASVDSIKSCLTETVCGKSMWFISHKTTIT